MTDAFTESEIKCKTAGNWPSDELTVQCSINACGKIEDGIGFRFKDRGAWGLAFSDLEQADRAEGR